MNTRILITGAQGFVGRYLVAHLLKSHEDVEVLGLGRSPRLERAFTHTISCSSTETDAPIPTDCENIDQDPRYDYASVDLGEYDQIAGLITDYQPHYVYHLASALRNVTNEVLFRSNVEGTINLLEAIGNCSESNPRVILGSTCGVYGIVSEASLPIHESHRCEPVDMYAVSKLAAEQAAKVLANQHNVPLMIARLFNLVGPGQDEHHACASFVAKSIALSENTSESELIVGRLDTTRDYIDVRDVASGLHLIAERGVDKEAYNLASGIETEMKEILDHSLALAGILERVTVRQQEDRPVNIPRHVADIEKLRLLGFQTRYSTKQSIQDLYQYYIGLVTSQTRATD